MPISQKLLYSYIYKKIIIHYYLLRIQKIVEIC